MENQGSSNKGRGPLLAPNQRVQPSQRARYEDLFDRMSDSTLLIDLDRFLILEANPAVELNLGFAPEQLVGRRITDFIMPEHAEAFEKTLRMSRRRYHPRTLDAHMRNASGQRLIMEINACVMKFNENEGVIQIIARDVTKVREAEKQLEALTITDEMTKLPNFRHFKNELEKEHKRSERYGTQYSIVFCDIDHFKQYNDTNGHPAGDEVLRLFSRILEEACRNTDQPARYGGEEFVVLAPGVDWEGAAILANRIRGNVERFKFPHGQKQPLGQVTVSIGVASFPADGSTANEILKAADEAVYASKTHGRNRVTTYAEAKAFTNAEHARRSKQAHIEQQRQAAVEAEKAKHAAALAAAQAQVAKAEAQLQALQNPGTTPEVAPTFGPTLEDKTPSPMPAKPAALKPKNFPPPQPPKGPTPPPPPQFAAQIPPSPLTPKLAPAGVRRPVQLEEEQSIEIDTTGEDPQQWSVQKPPVTPKNQAFIPQLEEKPEDAEEDKTMPGLPPFPGKKSA